MSKILELDQACAKSTDVAFKITEFNASIAFFQNLSQMAQLMDSKQIELTKDDKDAIAKRLNYVNIFVNNHFLTEDISKA